MNKKISVVISAYNEEKKIEECLHSVAWADEIILIDNTSSDKTVQIAKKYTSKVFIRPNNLMLNVNKNYGFSKATGEWILSLDADERVTEELKKEILLAIAEDHAGILGYWIPRRNIIFRKWMQYAGWYPDYQLRLFKNGKGKFEEKHVHEMVKIDGDSKHLTGDLLHYNYETITQFLYKHITIYAPNEADQLMKNGYTFVWHDAIRFPLKEFLSRFFAREGYKAGFHGLMLSLLMAFYHLVIFARIWELQGFKEVHTDTILEKTEKEFTNAQKELQYWFLKEKIKNVQNPFKKILLKLQNKLSS